MNIKEASNEEKRAALLSYINDLDESAMDDLLIDFLGWIDEDSEDYDLEIDTKDHP